MKKLTPQQKQKFEEKEKAKQMVSCCVLYSATADILDCSSYCMMWALLLQLRALFVSSC